MLSALKKLTLKQDAPSGVGAVPGAAGQTMSGSLQKKFSRGVQYNMKIIIKGDRNVGKSCLLERLQGKGFVETYTPTEQIQVASIQWSFKATEDIVKVEVWDVVDRGKARPRTTGLKLTTSSSAAAAMSETPALDAEFLDVYKGTHGVILMMDITKTWTFDYVTREIPKIPPEIPVLILGNHCDMGHHRVISVGQATALTESYADRPAEVIYAESSMRNGFGLRLLHKFLGLPFLRLQRETLRALIERNKRDTEICGFEIAEFINSDDSDYNKFLDNLSNKRRQIADSNSRFVSPSNGTNSSSASSAAVSAAQRSISSPGELRPTKSIIVGGGQPIIIPGQTNVSQSTKLQANISHLVTTVAPSLPSNDVITAIGMKNSRPPNANVITSSGSNGQRKSDSVKKTAIDDSKIVCVEEFCPDEGILDRSFLEDFASNDHHPGHLVENDSDSENDNGNPLVAQFNDEADTYDAENSPEFLKPNTADAKINPLAKNRKTLESFSNEMLLVRKFSISSDEIVQTNITSKISAIDEFDFPDTSIRRSPEGGEDTSSVPSTTQDCVVYNDDDESVSVKEESDGILEKKHRHKKKKDKKDKDERKEKKKKKRSKENDLEEFLNGTADDTSHAEESYEAI